MSAEWPLHERTVRAVDARSEPPTVTQSQLEAPFVS
jgi:hypothetical protein